MKNIILPLCLLAIISCKKDSDPAPATPKLNVKWTYTKETVTIKKYRDGSLKETVNDTDNFPDNEYWDFTNANTLAISSKDNTVSGQAAYAIKGDSVIIEPGNIFGAQIRAKVTNMTASALTLSYVGVATFANGMDSSFINKVFYKPSN